MSNIQAKPALLCSRRLRKTVAPPEPRQSLIATLQAGVNPQRDCPLFSTLPPELRNTIFRMVLTSYDDTTAPYPENNHYNRPGYRFRHRIDTALLSTCRRIYCEAHILPVSLNEHVFWASSGRGPPGLKYCDNPISQLSRLTIQQREAVKHVHLFTQMYWLEDTFPRLCNQDVFRMKHLKITIRHGDWWNWESNAPLAMQNSWTTNLKAIPTLESLEMELETMERDKSQLEAIVKSMQAWRIKLGNGRVLMNDGNAVVHNRYVGFSNYDGDQYDVQTNNWLWGGWEGHATIVPAPPLYYVGYTLRWMAKAV